MLADVLSAQDAVVYCLGTYAGSVSDEELRKITTDYTVEFARVFHAVSPDAEFSFLSGSGADQSGQSGLAFARYKGEAEKPLLAAGFPRIYLFRPAYIYPVEPREEPSPSSSGSSAARSSGLKLSPFCGFRFRALQPRSRSP